MQQHLERGNPELDTFTGHASGIAYLVRKIHQAHLGLTHALRSGMPKTQLNIRMIRLEQMITDWMYVTGRWDLGGNVSERALVDTSAAVLKINIERLREEVKR